MSDWSHSDPVVPFGVLVSASHVTAIRLLRDADAKADRLVVICAISGADEGTVLHDGPPSAFSDLAAAITQFVVSSSISQPIAPMADFDWLTALQETRSILEADISDVMATGPLSDATSTFVSAFRTQWAADLARNLETLHRDDLAALMQRLGAEIVGFGPRYNEAVEIRRVLQAWFAQWREDHAAAGPAGRRS